MFHYDICTEVDRDIFEKQCKALENLISHNFLILGRQQCRFFCESTGNSCRYKL